MPLNFLCCFSRQSNRQDEDGQSSENNTNEGMIPPHHSNQHLEGFGGARPRDSSAYPTVVISSNSSNSSSSSRGSSQSPQQSVIYLPTAIASTTPVPPTTFNIGNMTAQEEEIYLSSLISQTRNNNNNSNNIAPDEVSDIATIASTSLNENHEEEEDSDVEKFYSFKCLVCYKSEIPKQVILPCGHSQCCETCFNQMQKRYRRTRRYHLKTLQKESIRPGHDILCPTCRQDGILCHLFLGEEDLTSEIIPHIQDRSSSLSHH